MSKIIVLHQFIHHTPLFFGVASRSLGSGVYRWVSYEEFTRPMAKVSLAVNLNLRPQAYAIQSYNVRKL